MALSDCGRKVLVVDDDDFNRNVLALLLKTKNYEVYHAVDGLDAIEKFHRYLPDFIFMDVLMPRLDGYEAAKAIKKFTAERFVPIVFLTSLTSDQDLAHCVEAGGDDFLTKPFNEVILTSKMLALERTRDLYLTVQRQHGELQSRHQQLLEEEKVARDIYQRIVNPEGVEKPFIRSVISPLFLFNGDLLLFGTAPNGNVYVILGDATGHGLPAALCALPVSEMFYRSVRLQHSMASILCAINNRLKAILPTGYFMCIAAVEFIKDSDKVNLWNAGMPDILGFSREAKTTLSIVSSGLPLGISTQAEQDFPPVELCRDQIDMLYLYTDGIIETQNIDGELYGNTRLGNCIENNSTQSSVLDFVSEDVRVFMGVQRQNDDFTIIEIDCNKVIVN